LRFGNWCRFSRLDGRSRLRYREYAIPAPGKYLLRITGLKGGRDNSSAAVSFTRDMRFLWLGEFPDSGRPAGADTRQDEPRK
jgi:hypothetical protein